MKNVTDQEDTHLDEDQLLQAVVDERDLPASVQDHLAACPLCRGEKERFEQSLARFGHVAERFTPAPGRRVKLPFSESTRRPSSWYWIWRGALAAGVAVAAVMILVYGSITVKTTRETTLASLTQEMWADDRLMTEISELSENALPVFCLDISGESDPGLNEEFIDFVVPSIEGEVVSRNRGGVSC